MPGNPHECRLNAAHCSELAKTVVTSECQALLVLADTWKRLAAELEADQSLLQVLSELDLSSQPYEAFQFALNIHPGLSEPRSRSISAQRNRTEYQRNDDKRRVHLVPVVTQ